MLMPYTWVVQLPGMSGFREANRFAPLGLLAAALLAGNAIVWIRQHFTPGLLVVLIMATLELGWSAESLAGTVPAGVPAVDRAIAADHSQSVVVDVPLGFRATTLALGAHFPAEEQIEATLDGHPRAGAYLSRMPESTLAAVRRHVFFMQILSVQSHGHSNAAAIPAARTDARRIDVGWAIVWTRVTPGIREFLARTGFDFRYRADGVSVYRRLAR
jgi:hypothetical protein